MFGIGMPEMILILGLALIVVGPDKLPGLARSLAKGLLELKNTAQTLKDNITSESPILKEIQPELEDAAKSIKNHIIDSVEDKEKKDEFVSGVYDPLDDDDYDDEGEDDINPDETVNQQDETEADFVIEEGINKPTTDETNDGSEADDDLTEETTDNTTIEEPSKKEFTVHSTVQKDLNKEPKPPSND